MPSSFQHFKDKEAIEHVAETQALGKISSAEIHGVEVPGHYAAGADAAKETAVWLSILSLILWSLKIDPSALTYLLLISGCSMCVWKTGRAARLGWSRLERMHRILEQERWEIEHHRPQEREELYALYSAKGFEGKLLEDILDVLMADNERLLRVMIQEELNMSLHSQEHPLKQGVGAGIGVLAATFLLLLANGLLVSLWPAPLTAVGIVAIASGIEAYTQQNLQAPAIFWNCGLLILSQSIIYYLLIH